MLATRMVANAVSDTRIASLAIHAAAGSATFIVEAVKATSQRVFTSPLNDDVERVKALPAPSLVKDGFSNVSRNHSSPSESALVLGTA